MVYIRRGAGGSPSHLSLGCKWALSQQPWASIRGRVPVPSGAQLPTLLCPPNVLRGAARPGSPRVLCSLTAWHCTPTTPQRHETLPERGEATARARALDTSAGLSIRRVLVSPHFLSSLLPPWGGCPHPIHQITPSGPRLPPPWGHMPQGQFGLCLWDSFTQPGLECSRRNTIPSPWGQAAGAPCPTTNSRPDPQELLIPAPISLQSVPCPKGTLWDHPPPWEPHNANSRSVRLRLYGSPDFS